MFLDMRLSILHVSERFTCRTFTWLKFTRGSELFVRGFLKGELFRCLDLVAITILSLKKDISQLSDPRAPPNQDLQEEAVASAITVYMGYTKYRVDERGIVTIPDRVLLDFVYDVGSIVQSSTLEPTLIQECLEWRNWMIEQGHADVLLAVKHTLRAGLSIARMPSHTKLREEEVTVYDVSLEVAALCKDLLGLWTSPALGKRTYNLGRLQQLMRKYRPVSLLGSDIDAMDLRLIVNTLAYEEDQVMEWLPLVFPSTPSGWPGKT